jgi:hypothetical protein
MSAVTTAPNPPGHASRTAITIGDGLGVDATSTST